MFARMLRIFAGYVYTCHNQKKTGKKQKNAHFGLRACWLRESQLKQSHTHTTVDPRGTPKERQGMMCKPHHSQSSKGSKLGQIEETLEFPENARINIQATDFQFKYAFYKNARTASLFKLK